MSDLCPCCPLLCRQGGNKCVWLFIKHQSIDLVFSVVLNAVRVFPGRSVKNVLHATPAHGRKMISLFLAPVFVLLSFSLHYRLKINY